MNRRNRKWILSISVLAVLTISLHSCLQFRMSKSEIDSYFSKKKYKGKIITFKQGFRTVNYVIAGDDNKPLVVFVHGSPGSLSAFIDFLGDSALLEQAQLISVDRPGFGYANFGNAEPSLKKQADYLEAVISRHKNDRPVFLVGHSLGGPLIARFAIDYSDLVDGLIMVAPSIDPELEPKEWFRGPLATPFLRWILPRSFRASNDEIYQLRGELESMKPLLHQINLPTIVIQGTKDRLVPFQNAYFTKEKLTQSKVTIQLVDGMDHFVPWSNPELINKAIVDIIEQHHSLVKK